MALATITLFGCNEFLDKEPKSEITQNDYYNNSDQLMSYLYPFYLKVFETHRDYSMGTFADDNDTDNQSVGRKPSDIWAPGRKLVPNGGGEWDFSTIRDLNNFFKNVLPRYEAGKIEGARADIDQAIGEAYFLRAQEYFNRMRKLGDFPIITDTYSDSEKDKLIEISKRRPQNEVARFILEDLDRAIKLLKPSPVSNKNRVSKEVAYLLKSRVALFEGTWLKYHKGTAFVPGGAGWPGAQKDYLKGFTIDIDSETNYFLTEAKNSAKYVADRVALTENTHEVDGKGPLSNPYYLMFADINMAKYPEVLLWRDYNGELAVRHATQTYLRLGQQSGYTRDLVDAFLGKTGYPIYKWKEAEYKGDVYINNVCMNRDERLQLFMKKPNDVYTLDGKQKYPYIRLTEASYNAPTGYAIRKGLFYDSKAMEKSAIPNENGAIIFRGAEAYLNYIEAQYELEKALDANSRKYWGDLRERAGIVRDVDVTINNTDLSKERDWAKYSHGQLVDETLYNIRRERRSEFIAEGFRMDDLRRWRALDGVKNYQVEGFRLWAKYAKTWFKNKPLRYYPESNSPNVSNPELSEYLRPLQIIKDNNYFWDGYTWTKANYYEPVAAKQFQLTSPDGDPNKSVIYQNPGWPLVSGLGSELD
ncbi:RagB/SusD family nutrient uptake outer membrane protein [Ornithobacterium rhinotracheale]|uniref:RagB/SusD family nutrient uptake outer membrane protein n=1 Tax=Ornithobacterium rhinotracheale TaxID=28251 RepID=UPI0040351C02